MLAVLYALLVANWLHPEYRFRSALVNSIIFTFVQVIPVLIAAELISGARGLTKLYWSLALVFPILGALLLGAAGATCAAFVTSDGEDRSHVLLRTIPAINGQLSIYQTNGGATTSFGIIVWQERELFPGLLRVRKLAQYYPARDVEIHVRRNATVQITVPPYFPGDQTTVEEYQLKPLLIVPSV